MSETTATKQCPFCAETIKAEAVLCRYCGKELKLTEPTPQAPTSPLQQVSAPPSPAVQSKERIKFRRGCLLALAAIVLLLAVAIGFSSPRSSAGITSAPARTTEYDFYYRISGTATSADITYTNAGGDIEQQNDQALPWAERFVVKPGQFVSVSAQNNSEFGTIVCEIWLDNQVVKRSESKGAYAIASCSGSI